MTARVTTINSCPLDPLRLFLTFDPSFSLSRSLGSSFVAAISREATPPFWLTRAPTTPSAKRKTQRWRAIPFPLCTGEIDPWMEVSTPTQDSVIHAGASRTLGATSSVFTRGAVAPLLLLQLLSHILMIKILRKSVGRPQDVPADAISRRLVKTSRCSTAH